MATKKRLRNYNDIRKMSRSQLESEYEKQARQARKSIRQIREKYPNIVGLEDFGSDFKTLAKLGNITDEQLRKEVLYTTNFNKSQFRSPEAYTEYREGVIEEMGRKSYNITEENYDVFARGMKQARNSGLLNVIPSDVIADFYSMDVDPKRLRGRMKAITEMYEKGEIDADAVVANFEYWFEHQDELERFVISPKRKSSYDDYY